MSEFPWNENPMVESKYKENNYEVILTGSKQKKVIIFFSSHGIYYPNTEQTFAEKMVKEDYYDWRNLARHKLIKNNFAKIIFVRDIYKQWYVTGINERINSIDKLKNFLEEENRGYEITTCGSSAGGYIALLMGVLLNATRIIDSCGQHDLSLLKENPLIDKYNSDVSRSKYYNVKPFLKGKAENIYYFYPSECQSDIIQSEAVASAITKRFVMKGSLHGETVRAICFPYILTMEKDKLDSLQKKYDGQIIDRAVLFKDMIPFSDRLIYYFRYGFKKLIEMKKKRGISE